MFHTLYITHKQRESRTILDQQTLGPSLRDVEKSKARRANYCHTKKDQKVFLVLF